MSGEPLRQAKTRALLASPPTASFIDVTLPCPPDTEVEVWPAGDRPVPPTRDQLERENASLSRRLAVRFEETQAAYAVIDRLMSGWTPDGASWWRNSGTTSDLITEAEHRALRAAEALSGGVPTEEET